MVVCVCSFWGNIEMSDVKDSTLNASMLAS